MLLPKRSRVGLRASIVAVVVSLPQDHKFS